MSRLLTDDEKKRINHAISQKSSSDDRNPEIVIREDFEGDPESYFRAMAVIHRITIDE